MAEHHGAVTADSGMDMPAHEATYTQFIELTKTLTVFVLTIVLLLLLWGLEGHGILALLGFVVLCAGGALGGLTGLGWKLVAPVFGLVALACIVL